MKYTLTAAIAISLAFSLSVHAKNPPPKKTHKAHMIPAPQKVVWDAWYTVTILPKTPYGYYNDRVEQLDGKLAYKNRFWKNEEGFINEEALASFAEDPSLKPAFFNFHSQFRSTETMIDGTVSAENQLNVSVRQGENSKTPIKRILPKGVFLSAFFPLWLKENTKTMKVGETKTFSTILEDNVDDNFETKSGTVRLEAQDEYAKANQAKKFKVTRNDEESTWYVNDAGMPLKILMTSQKVVVEKTSQALAEKFLKTQ
jgi:hypothetical protein